MARKTIDDVAALAGVSIKTVSRVMNNEPNVRPETRDRVREAMAALDYQPSLHARSLAGRRSKLVGLVYDNPSASYVMDVQSGAMTRCRAEGYRLFIQPCNDMGEDAVAEVLAMVEQTHVDGLVIAPPMSGNAKLLRALERRNVTFVCIAPDDQARATLSVMMDDEAAAREMTAYLVGLGHRDIGFIAGHPEHVSSRQRLQGFQKEMESRGLKIREAWMAHGFNTVASGAEAGRQMLSKRDRPTAIFASNDDMAAGVLMAAHELGVSVPGDLSVSGFDDTQLASVVWPSLTTVRQPSCDMAHAAVGLLIDRLAGKKTASVVQLAYDMVVRGSTAALPAAVKRRAPRAAG
ncbi:LacI family DNA-binding transcriptional regulator [Pedomonas mirosovicensis]|uniref:LacI family DNA-binding transcriptional regulator n=1 Tax=Pedomonas mirosovicensis TaxID=2908641 RepID=UPI002167186C|nr:LacI family DNA-binding transcriptional regulator [Pedomonas mirosovicensis]MCH8686214.1 LacI family DNA-binding transcriptional regulator [Pedomonas mirosovicensis]